MSNWGTAVQMATERVQRYGSADPDIIKRALCEAFAKYEATRFWFNTETQDFNTVNGTYEYGAETSAGAFDGYPIDMIKPVKLSMQVTSSWYHLKNISIDEFRDKFMDVSYKGFPSAWAWFKKEMLIYPVPNAVYAIRVDYIKDLGVPKASYNGVTWSYLVSTTGTAIADSYTNDWFTEGLELIVSRAVWYVASQHFGKHQQAQLAKMHEVEMLDDLLVDSHDADLNPDPRPWE
jgi:hypothetical protein